MPRASVVVPTFNRSTRLQALLLSVLDQDYPHDYEVVVVDDGSADETPRILETWRQRHPERIRTLRQENSGPARARNRAAWAARGAFLAFVDDDCVAERSWLRSLEMALESTRAASVAGVMVNREASWVGRYVNRESVIDHVAAPDGSVAELITANAAVRTDVFQQLGGFDETIRVAGGEDTEFSVRLRAAGHRIAWAPAARVSHDPPGGVGHYLHMIYRHGRGRRRLGLRFPAYRLSVPYLRLLWLAWPIRPWMLHDYLRYRGIGVAGGEAARYVALRYLENIVRTAGYIRGT